VYVDDELFAKVYRWADWPTRDAMDFAHLAGQRPGDSLRMKEQDIKKEASKPDDPPDWDGRVLYVSQNKTGAKVRIRVIGKLAEVIDRIMLRKVTLMNGKSKRKIRSLALVVNERGFPLTASALDGRFGIARECANVGTMEFQFRDLRAKAATETEDARGMDAAQDLLGHANAAMTKDYVRRRQGKLVNPTK
jgi:integrase